MSYSSFTISPEVWSIWSCNTCSLCGLGGWDPVVIWEWGWPICPSSPGCDWLAARTGLAKYYAVQVSSRAFHEDVGRHSLRCLPPRWSFCWCPSEMASWMQSILRILLEAWRKASTENLVTASPVEHRFSTFKDLWPKIDFNWYL